MDQTPETPVIEIQPGAHTSWPVLAGLVVLLLGVSAGAYFLSSTTPKSESDTARVESLEAQSESTDPEAIEADIAAQSPEEFEKGFDTAFAELDASLAQ